MDGFNIGKIILGLKNPSRFIKMIKPDAQNVMNSATQGTTSQQVQQQFQLQNPQMQGQSQVQQSQVQPQLQPQGQVQSQQQIQNQGIQNQVQSQIQQQAQSDAGYNSQNIHNNISSQLSEMNAMQGTNQSVFVKNLLGLPQDLSKLLMTAQNLQSPLAGGTLAMSNINAEIFNSQKALASIFNEEVSAELNNIIAQTNIQQAAQVKQDAVVLLFSGMISLPEISKIILANSKSAVANLIIAMAAASRQGIKSDQLQDTLGIINSCISMAESNNPAQNLKSLMMLYLPWLPLNDGVGFDLEITPQDGENDSNASKLTVLIQTKNFGNIKGVFTLTTSNSVDIFIVCTESFPKGILQKNLSAESMSHSMNTNIDIEQVKPVEEDIKEVNETKVNLSATNEMNPYLLLMAHSFIRNTILIDNGV